MDQPRIGNETSSLIDPHNQTSGGEKASSPEQKQQKSKNSESSHQPARKSESLSLPSGSAISEALRNSKSLEELTKPLLENDQPQETSDLKELNMPFLESDNEGSAEKVEDAFVCSSPSNSAAIDRSISSIQLDKSKPKKVGRRERMFDLRKKMSKKFEEKKSRHIVEKMRAPSEK
ncbi:uncharacterized protein [Cicer arietinum]|uniref:uncharacterized protein isoform X1 n=1 Tax=Cicer arietinum TaxID=3827 RepID=UPI00032AB9A2